MNELFVYNVIMDDDRLELVLTYNMTKIEAKAFKLCLIWEELVFQEFPKENHIKLRYL